MMRQRHGERTLVRSTGIATATVVGYLIGTSPVADAVTSRHGVRDLRGVGDGNPGFWNAREQIGTRAALPIFAGDLAKGAVAAGLGRATAPAWWLPYLTGGASMVGHAFPIRRSGGRSVLTFVGAATVAAPRPAALAWTTLAAGWLATRQFERSVHIAVAAFPLWQLAIEGRRRTALTGLLMSFVGWRMSRLDGPRP